MPLHGDDFQFIQDAINEGLKGALHRFTAGSSGNMILSGCGVTDNGAGNYDVAEGYVVLGYEICYVPAHSFVSASGLSGSSIKLSTTYDSDGQDTFADAVVRDTYEVRRALASDGLSGGNEIVLDAPDKLQVSVYDVMKTLRTETDSLTDLNSFSNLGDVDEWGDIVNVRVKSTGTYSEDVVIELEGWCQVFQLPAGFRPTGSSRKNWIAADDNGVLYKGIIKTDGVVAIQVLGGASPGSIGVYISVTFFV